MRRRAIHTARPMPTRTSPMPIPTTHAAPFPSSASPSSVGVEDVLVVDVVVVEDDVVEEVEDVVVLVVVVAVVVGGLPPMIDPGTATSGSGRAPGASGSTTGPFASASTSLGCDANGRTVLVSPPR